MKCLHCGEKCLKGAKYCCIGCEFANKFIKSIKLESYYEFCKKIYNSKPMKVIEYDNQVDYIDFINEKDENFEINLNIEGIHCGSCVWLIENALEKEEEILSAKVNLSTQRMIIQWSGNKKNIKKYISIIQKLGFKPHPFEVDEIEVRNKDKLKALLLQMAVAGFGAIAVMMLTMGVWFGNTDGTMKEYSRLMLHLAALIVAVPTTLYSAQEFFSSSVSVLRNLKVNMDVPISMSIVVALSISVYQVFINSEYVYFDAALMLIFFLLIGRYLDLKVRNKARQQTHNLVLKQPKTVTVFKGEKLKMIHISKAKVGDLAFVAVGESIPVDGVVEDGEGSVDQSVITGESLPVSVKPGDKVIAGSVNLDVPIKVRVSKKADDSTLSEIIKLIEIAEQKGSSYIRIADKIAGYFTPIIISLAVITFLGWVNFTGGYQDGLIAAASVLIIACPCAIGLAVPIVQVVAGSKLMTQGILIKTPDSLEKVKYVNRVFFDKTGTLTEGKPKWVNEDEFTDLEKKLISSIASKSNHPLSQAMKAVHVSKVLDLKVTEVKGSGLKCKHRNKELLLGKREFVGASLQKEDAVMEVWFKNGNTKKRLKFEDTLKSGSKSLISKLNAQKIEVELISGDRESVVKKIAKEIGIKKYRAHLSPKDKYLIVEEAKKRGELVMFVGDGLNDSIAMEAADVSLSPSNSLDLTLSAADIVFYGNDIKPVSSIIETSKFSQKLILQNFIMSFVYNFVTIPLAIFGFVTPVLAAIVMSSSSILVVGNSLRLKLLNAK